MRITENNVPQWIPINSGGSGGVGPYFYYWPSEAYNGSTLSNVGAGVFPVIVTDYNGCVLNQNGTLLLNLCKTGQRELLEIARINMNNRFNNYYDPFLSE